MSDLTTIQVVEPDHYEVVVMYSTGIAALYRVIADDAKQAAECIREHVKTDALNGHVNDVRSMRFVSERHTTFVKVLP